MSTVPAAFDIDPSTPGVQNTAELNAVTGASISSTSGDNVRAVQWTGLVAAINRMRFHQAGAGSNLSIAGVSIGGQKGLAKSLNNVFDILENLDGAPFSGIKIKRHLSCVSSRPWHLIACF
jgi:hypothetical protein